MKQKGGKKRTAQLASVEHMVLALQSQLDASGPSARPTKKLKKTKNDQKSLLPRHLAGEAGKKSQAKHAKTVIPFGVSHHGGPPQVGGVADDEAYQALVKWSGDASGVEAWAASLDLASQLGPRPAQANATRVGPLVILRDALPAEVAESARLAILELEAQDWDLAEAGNDAMGGGEYGAGSTKHRFRGSDGGRALKGLFGALGKLVPSTTGATFAAGRYERKDYIEPHDDKGFKDVSVEGMTVQCSRDIAVVLYLSHNWTEEDGGLFVDHGTMPPSAIVPQFNTLVAFRVPRLHEVTPVLTDTKRRYSIFGWLLTEGQLYPIKGGSRKKRARLKKSKKQKATKK